MGDNPIRAATFAPYSVHGLAADDVVHLAEVLRHWPTPLWGAAYAGDGWVLFVRDVYRRGPFQWLAVEQHDGDRLLITDADLSVRRPLAMALPTAAPSLVTIMAAAHGAAAFELSAGWASAVRRAAGLFAPAPRGRG